MKAIFRADYSRGGFITSTLAPCDRRNEPKFSMFRGLVLIGLVFGLAAMVRLLIAH
jgi:hypothetical protein